MQRSLLLFLFLFLAVPWTFLGQVRQNGVAVLARAGRDVVTEQEFRQRFELLPRPLGGGGSTVAAAKEALILSMVAEKFLARAAEREGLNEDPGYVRDMENVRRLLARDELYRVEIQRKVSVTGEEISAGLRDVAREMLVEYAYAPTTAGLDSFRFDTDTSASSNTRAGLRPDVIRDTITVRWGEAERPLEQAVFALRPGEVSRPVETSVGWMVCRVLREGPRDDVASLGASEVYERVRQTIRLRKEEDRLGRFVAETMNNDPAIARKQTLTALATALRKRAEEDPAFLEKGLSRQDRDRIGEMLGPSSRDTLLLFKGGSMSVDDVLGRLYAAGTKLGVAAHPALEGTLNALFRVWTWQATLESIALERGMDARPEVNEQLQMWKDHYLSEAYRRTIERKVRTSDVEIHRLRRFTDPACEVPVVDVLTAYSREEGSLRTFLADAADGSLVSRVDGIRMEAIDRAQITSLGSLADMLWEGRSGTWTPAVRTDSGYVSGRLLRVVKDVPLEPHTADSLRAMLREMKTRRAESMLVANIASAEGYAIYGDRLNALNVSGTPMMAFRMLGFGGRMFAVPFVRQRTDWYDIEQGRGQVVP